MAAPIVLVGAPDSTPSTDISQYVDVSTLVSEDTGNQADDTATFEVLDKAIGITGLEPEGRVRITQDGKVRFNGFIQTLEPAWEGISRRFRVSAVGISRLLDVCIIPPGSGGAYVRSAGESDKHRIIWLLTTFGQPFLTAGSSTYTYIQRLETNMPRQNFANLTLRQAIERVLGAASESANYYVDTLGRLHTWDNDNEETDAAPFAINTAAPTSAQVPPSDLRVMWDTSELVNYYYVRGKNAAGSGPYSNATSISTYGRRQAFIDGPDSDTRLKARRLGRAALKDTKDPLVRCFFAVEADYCENGSGDIWQPGQKVSITSPAHNMSGYEIRILRVTTSYLNGAGDRRMEIECGALRANFLGGPDGYGGGTSRFPDPTLVLQPGDPIVDAYPVPGPSDPLDAGTYPLDGFDRVGSAVWQDLFSNRDVTPAYSADLGTPSHLGTSYTVTSVGSGSDLLWGVDDERMELRLGSTGGGSASLIGVHGGAADTLDFSGDAWDISFLVNFEADPQTFWTVAAFVNDGTNNSASTSGSTSNQIGGRLVRTSATAATIGVTTDGNGTNVWSTAAVTVTTGVDYRFRVQREGTTIRARVWLASEVEPSTWDVSDTITDDSPYDKDRFSIYTIEEQTVNQVFDLTIDDLIVEGLPAALSSSAVTTGSGTSITVELPDGLTTGDALLVFMAWTTGTANNLESGTYHTPNWQDDSYGDAFSTFIHQGWAWKQLDGTEGFSGVNDTFDIDLISGSVADFYAVAVRIPGIDVLPTEGFPWNAFSDSGEEPGSTPTYPTWDVTSGYTEWSTSDPSMRFVILSGTGSVSGLPTGFTEVASVNNGSLWFIVAYKNDSASANGDTPSPDPTMATGYHILTNFGVRTTGSQTGWGSIPEGYGADHEGPWQGGNTWQTSGTGAAFSLDGSAGLITLTGDDRTATAILSTDAPDDASGEPWGPWADGRAEILMKWKVNPQGDTADTDPNRLTLSILDGVSRNKLHINLGDNVSWSYMDPDQQRGIALATGSATYSDFVAKTIASDTWYYTRFDFRGTTLRAKLWAASAAEPSTWDVTLEREVETGLSELGQFRIDFDGNDGMVLSVDEFDATLGAAAGSTVGRHTIALGDGSTVTFSTDGQAFVPGTLSVWVDNQPVVPSSYDAGSGTFTLARAPYGDPDDSTGSAVVEAAWRAA